ncbi:MAG: methyltransferase domain-containing protein [Alphaproteobacteria bacterium]
MPALHHRRDRCQLCDSNSLTMILSLAPTPPANAFVPESELDREQPYFPLDVFQCEDCHHVQLVDVVDPAALFENYVYVSGTSPAFVKHFEEYATTVCTQFQPGENSLVVDIGSNDGTLLRFFKQRGHRVLGIDPARDIAAAATGAGIETLPAFFTPPVAADIVAEYGPATIVTANNVFAHAEDLYSIASGIADLLAPDGVFTFEVSYLVDVFEDVLFDTIYHEHMAYHAVGPLQRFFMRAGLELFAAERVSSHGGSLRGYVQKVGGPHPAGGTVDTLIDIEKRLGLDRSATLKEFGARIDGLRDRFIATLRDLTDTGKSIAGYGAPAKATTLLHHFGIEPGTLKYIIDDSPLKQGLYSPGQHIPVVSSDILSENPPDILVILAWNFADVIIKNNADFANRGGKFLIPVPEVRLCP